MKTLVLGASGATGKLVVSQLLERQLPAKIVIRETATLPDSIARHKAIEIVKGNIDSFTVADIRELLRDCQAIVCCLGHNISLKGIFGQPRKLVVNAVKKVISAAASDDVARKFILMSTTAYTNRQQGEQNTFGEQLVFALLKIVLPPHKDNMLAGDFLTRETGAAGKMEWATVRPDSLFDAENVSEYQISAAKTRSPIFNPGKTSRINVAHFMVDLLINDHLWNTWKFKTPVVYNKE